MVFRGRPARIAAALVLSCLLPSLAGAQESRLKLPTFAAGAAAAADWASTYHALKFYRVREVNPILAPFDDNPAHVVWLGAAIDVGSVTAWNLALGKDHPRIAAGGLWAMAAFRAALAIHNVRNERRSARR